MGFASRSGATAGLRPARSRWFVRALTDLGVKGFWSCLASCAGAMTEADCVSGGFATGRWACFFAAACVLETPGTIPWWTLS
jgi:hypothetical protein